MQNKKSYVRQVAAAVIALSLTVIGRGVEHQIGFQPGVGPIMRAEVPFDTFARTYRSQRATQWCWAASIANVFSYYGHPVSQEKIVQRLYGTTVNFPARSAMEIAALVNTEWVDDAGKRFRAVLTAAYDAYAGVNMMNNNYLINQLRQNRPILMCNTHHCMVVTLVDYSPFQVMAVGVFDPWPIGPAAHSLPYPEAVALQLGGQMTFLGAVTITEVGIGRAARSR